MKDDSEQVAYDAFLAARDALSARAAAEDAAYLAWAKEPSKSLEAACKSAHEAWKRARDNYLDALSRGKA